jgi:hypothetical protein
MTAAKKDGLYLLAIGSAIFLLFGIALQFSAGDSREDFKAVVYGARCLLHHCDPYNEQELFRYYQGQFPEPLASHLRSHTLTLYVNLPATILFVSPFAMLPFAAASALWSILTAASLILAAFLAWDLASGYAPTLAGALIALSLISAAVVLGNGNPAGIVIALSVISVWCFVRQRFIVAGVLCLAISLALKPHDAGLVWLYLLLAGGILRKRALQTLGVTALLSLVAVLWVYQVSPHWIPELRSNMAIMSGPGGNNDAGPDGPTSRKHSAEMIVDLQSAISVFRDDPTFYNAAAWLVCGTLLLLWILATLRSHSSPADTWLALAAITPLTMLITYHRAYDTRLLMLAVPACAMLYAGKGIVGRLALAITALALIFTGEVPSAFLRPITANLPPISAGPLAKLATLFLARPAPLVLLLMAVFYLCVYASRILRPSMQESPAEISQPITGS